MTLGQTHVFGMENRNKFCLMQEVAELAVKRGGKVFGGYVRDFILHEVGCKKFFAQKHTNQQFEDTTVSPETLDRLLVPKDVDVHFKTHEDAQVFERDLVDRSFMLKKRRIRYGVKVGYTLFLSLEMKLALTNESCVSRTMLRNQFRDVVKLVPGGQFNVDILVCSDEEFSTNLDFECNGLIMNESGIQLGSALSSGLSPIGMYRRLQEVTDDIEHKRARVVNLIQNRWKKMDERPGWELFGFNVSKVESDPGDVCIICHDTLPMMYKFNCCNARYHKECLLRTLTAGFASECIQCKSDVYIGEEEKKVCVQG